MGVVLQIVHVSASDGKKRTLIDTTVGMQEGRVKPDAAMPQNLKLPQENALQAAGRLANDMLNMKEGLIRWKSNPETFEETNDLSKYPSIQTVYRKEIMSGELITADKSILKRLAVASGNAYTVVDGSIKREFQWMSENQCKKNKPEPILIGKPANTSEFSALVSPPIGLDEDELNDFMHTNKVDTSAWGQAPFKSLEDFSEELVKGESTLIKQGKDGVARVVDIVVLQLVRQGTGEIIVEASETYKDSSQELNRLPALKRRSDEHMFVTARKMVTKHLALPDNCVTIDSTDVKMVVTQEGSKAYPGLLTIYRKRFMKGILLST